VKKIAIVTGASSGLGAEFARLLSQDPGLDEVWGLARRRDNLDRLAAASKGERIRPLAADLASAEGVESLRSLLERERPEIRVLVLNAGRGSYGPFSDTAKDDILGMIDINVRSLTEIAKDALSYMAEGSGMILVASLAGMGPLGGRAVYAATKAYVLSLGVALAAELRPRGIRVTTLCPGPVATEFAAVASGGRVGPQAGSASPARIVRRCLADFAGGKVLSYGRLRWRLTATLMRFAGRFATARFTLKFMTR
jgi:short-subunit dehydrogenase